MEEEVVGVYARFYPFIDRFVEIGVRDGAVVHVSFTNAERDDASADHPILDRIDDYLTGTVEEDFSDVAMDFEVDPEHRAILEVVRSIPYGHSAGVDDVARDVAGMNPDDSGVRTTIRTALDANPVPLLIPDHRVRDGPSGAPPDVEQRLRAVEQSGG